MPGHQLDEEDFTGKDAKIRGDIATLREDYADGLLSPSEIKRQEMLIPGWNWYNEVEMPVRRRA